VLAAGIAMSAQILLSTSSADATETAAAGDATDSQPVIVVLRDQIAAAPANAQHMADRRSRATSAQHSVLGRLSGAKPSKVRNYTSVNGFAATVTGAQAAALAADPAVLAVLPDRTISVQPAPAPGSAPPAAARKAPKAASSAAAAPPGACPTDPSKPLLEPEALQDTRTEFLDPSTPSAHQIATGKGVTVAFIADGIDPNIPDFIRADGSHAIIDYQDFSGDGPNSLASGAEAFGDASSIVAQGRVTYDVADFVNPSNPLPTGCTIRIRGMAPDANVIAIKAGGELLPNSAILQAIDYAITKHVDVINESFGGNVIPDNSSRDTIQLFNEAAVRQGITVTTSTGDAGITGTIGSPSTNPDFISVGATTNSRLYAQTSYAAFKFSNGTWANDNISALSSGGFTQGGRTMDLVAPGEAGWAVCSDSGNFVGCTNFAGGFSRIEAFGGTSQSAPLTAGAAALVIEAYRNAHHGASPTPAQVKQLLTSTAHDLGLPAEEQGAGELDARAAVEAATTVGNPGSNRAGVSSNVLVSPAQVDLTASPGQHRSAKVTVTNAGTKDLTVSLGTRRFATISDRKQTVALNANTDPTFPYATNGAPWAYKKATFDVPPGTDRLGAAVAWPGAPKDVSGTIVTPVVRMTLLDPDGTFQTNTRPQGGAASANFGFVDVRQPKAGKWTAIFYTVAGASGFTGNMMFETSAQRAVPAGSASPAVQRLHPGQVKAVNVSLTAPDTSGDTSESITIGSSDGHQTSVPVILRTLVDIKHGSGQFTGTITGGNARAFAPAEMFSYAFDVPAGQHDLGVGVTLAKDPNVTVEGVLVDPNGEQADVSTNARFNGAGEETALGRTLQGNAVNPMAGRWRFVLVVQNPVSGNELAQSFNGTVAFNRDKSSVSGLGATLPAGKPSKVTVSYTNTGVAPVLLQVDPRRNAKQTLQLVPFFASATLQLPLNPESSVPAYLVPPGSDRLTLAATSSTPAQVELSQLFGGIDVFGDLRSAQHGDTVSVARVSESNGWVAPGFWSDFVQQIGPFPGPAPAGTSTLVATVRTQQFDRDVTSSTGDCWIGAVDATADTGTPVLVQPGQTVQVAVTITPSGHKGSHVDGVLYLVTAAHTVGTFNSSGEVVGALPYSYTVG
jgi:hypothetical protein